MNNFVGKLSVLVFFSIFIFSCKEDTSIPDMGYDYLPEEVGRYIIYDVDSTYYDDFFVPTKAFNYKFQLKEKIQSIYYDNQNRPTLRLERYVKHYDSLVPYSSIPWTLRDVWSANKNTTNFEKVEENVRKVRLIFPVRKNRIWDVNVQNTSKKIDFAYEKVDVPDVVGNQRFDLVLETIYDDGGKILTNRKYCVEKYARNVGLIYHEEILVESQPPAGANSTELQLFYGKTIMNRITSGFQYTMTVNSFGIE